MGREEEKEPVAAGAHGHWDGAASVAPQLRSRLVSSKPLGDVSAASRLSSVVRPGATHSWRGPAPGEGPPGDCSHSCQVRLWHCPMRQSSRS